MPVLGVEGVVFDEAGRVLLTQRRDLPFWCLPGGYVDAGETPMEAVVREVAEETGLEVEVERLVGVYCMPHWRAGGATVLLFCCRRQGGALQLTSETIDVGYFAPDALPADLVPMHKHKQRINDAVANVEKAFLRTLLTAAHAAHCCARCSLLRTLLISWPLRVDEHSVIARRLVELDLTHDGFLTTELLQKIRERQFDVPPKQTG